MVFDIQRKLELKRARLALTGGNLDEASRILCQPALRELKEGQELSYELAEALSARAEQHASCANLPEALVDLNRAVELGGAKPRIVQLRNELLEKLNRRPAEGPAAGSTSAPSPPAATPRVAVLWLEGVGTYVLLPFPRVSLGRVGSSVRPDIPLAGRMPGNAAEIIRTGEQYVLAAHSDVTVNGKKVAEKALAPGDRIRVEDGAELRFYLPCPLSATAVLRFETPSLLPGKALEVILLDQFVMIGTKGLCHIKTVSGPRQIVLFVRDGSFWARTEGPLVTSGETLMLGAGSADKEREHRLGFNERIMIDGLRFTLTEG
jgi:hypothetical protein